MRGSPRPHTPGPRLASKSETRGSRLGTNGAGLARRPSFTEMPSASTPVHGFHRIRPSHSYRRVAFDDSEVLERRFHSTRSMRRTSFIRAPREGTTFGIGPAQRFEAPNERPVGGRCVAGICHHLTTAANSLARGFPDSPNCTSRARLRWPILQRMGSSLRSRAVIRLATFTDLGRPAVDAANRASKPAPRTITTGATSSRGGWADAA